MIDPREETSALIQYFHLMAIHELSVSFAVINTFVLLGFILIANTLAVPLIF